MSEITPYCIVFRHLDRWTLLSEIFGKFFAGRGRQKNILIAVFLDYGTNEVIDECLVQQRSSSKILAQV